MLATVLGRDVAAGLAADAARSAAGYQSTAGRGQADAADFLASVAPHLLTGAVVTVTRGPRQVTTTIHAHVLSVIPFGSFSVDEHASAPLEQFVAVPRGFRIAEGSSTANRSAGGG